MFKSYCFIIKDTYLGYFDYSGIFQVQTTAKALAETRDKFIEEEKKKQMKESRLLLL